MRNLAQQQNYILEWHCVQEEVLDILDAEIQGTCLTFRFCTKEIENK